MITSSARTKLVWLLRPPVEQLAFRQQECRSQFGMAVYHPLAIVPEWWCAWCCSVPFMTSGCSATA